MTLLAMLRHGATEWSAEGRLQGRTDTALSDSGRAALRGRAMPDGFGAFRPVTSPLRRCVETAALLGLRHAAPEDRIAEMSWGEWEGRRLAELRAELGAAMVANEARGFDFRPDQGESPREVLARVTPWLADIAAARRDTVAVSHRGVMRVVCAWAWGWNLCGKPPARLDWNTLQLFRLDATGRPEVVSLNLPLLQRGCAMGAA